ncbi:hypothetical protein J1614_002388 [Plenodomus biglobosus]|nr:hypothetical protein J1614_002388 [Plenodomus biglobosus]
MFSLAMAPIADLTAHPPPARIPKLKYRNPLPSDQASLSSQQSHDTGSTSASVQDRSTTPDSNPPSTTSRPSVDTASLSPPSLASTLSSPATSNDSRSSKKKKKAGAVLSFLSLKEPSQSALDQFAEQQRKQAVGKGSTATLYKSTSNYANQKLPRAVPKVNSKWDGIPAVSKTGYATASASSKDNRHSHRISRGSFGTRLADIAWDDSRLTVVTDGSRNAPNSTISPESPMSNMTARDGFSPTSSPAFTTLPEMSYYFLNTEEQSGPSPSMAAEESRPSTELPPGLSNSTWATNPSLDESSNFGADSPASSTDSVDTVVRETAENIFRKLNDQPQQSLWGDDGHAVQSADQDYVPDSHDFLFSEEHVAETEKNDSPMATDLPMLPVPHYVPARPVQNFSRPASSSGPRPASFRSLSMSSYRRTPPTSALPTLYEVSLASSTESLGTVRDKGDGDDKSIASSTIAESELSKHWYESPRERLGLGGRLKMNDVSPWDSQGETRASCLLSGRNQRISDCRARASTF